MSEYDDNEFEVDPEQVEDWLDGYGWRVREHLGYDELGKRYVEPTGRGLGWMAIERIVDAERACAEVNTRRQA